MKILSCFAVSLAASFLNSLPCHAETPNAPAPTTTSATPAAKDVQELKTRKFKVPRDPGCFPSGHVPPIDPGDSKPPLKPAPRDPRAVLQSAGISFEAPGSTAFFDPENSILTMTNTEEQLEKVMDLFVGRVRQGQVHLEVFSMPPLTARKALIAHPKESALYAWLDAELAKPDSSVKLERHSITIVRGGQKSKTEGIAEIQYATEFIPPAVSQSISLPAAGSNPTNPAGSSNFAPWLHTSSTPKSFEFRNAGDTFEVEMTIADDGKTVDLNMAPETVRRLGIVKFGLREDIFQPVFQTQKFSGQASGIIGQPMLISTFSPPVNTGVPHENKVDRTWLLFVTVKHLE